MGNDNIWFWFWMAVLAFCLLGEDTHAKEYDNEAPVLGYIGQSDRDGHAVAYKYCVDGKIVYMINGKPFIMHP